MNDKYLKIYRYPKGTIFNQVVKVDEFKHEKVVEGLEPAEDIVKSIEDTPEEDFA
tara:strand:+ start:303 stop:467 length:165 start_codon:yes stop_codon:yes gene_type:complete